MLLLAAAEYRELGKTKLIFFFSLTVIRMVQIKTNSKYHKHNYNQSSFRHRFDITQKRIIGLCGREGRD